MVYDSTLGFADRAGFRCGVCFEYSLYDVAAREPLKLRERPLIVMECSVIDERYMAFGTGERAFETMVGLRRECERYNGDFTLLWHNHRLLDRRERELYEAVLDA